MDGVLGKLGGTGSLVGRGARKITGSAVSAAQASWRAVRGLVPEHAPTTAEAPLAVSLSATMTTLRAEIYAGHTLFEAIVVQRSLGTVTGLDLEEASCVGCRKSRSSGAVTTRQTEPARKPGWTRCRLWT